MKVTRDLSRGWRSRKINHAILISYQRNRVFGAGLDTQPAGAALFGVDEQRLLPAMRCPFESADESQTLSQVSGKRIHFENGIRAGGHAIRFAFAFVAVNYGDKDTRVLAAGGGVGHIISFSVTK